MIELVTTYDPRDIDTEIVITADAKEILAFIETLPEAKQRFLNSLIPPYGAEVSAILFFIANVAAEREIRDFVNRLG